jgi:hypothetical protein
MSEINCIDEKDKVVTVYRADNKEMIDLKNEYLNIRKSLFAELQKLGLKFEIPNESDYQKHLNIDFEEKQFMDTNRYNYVMSTVQRLIRDFNGKVKSFQKDVDGGNVKKLPKSRKSKVKSRKSKVESKKSKVESKKSKKRK